jgi:hypothetical protein
VSGVLQLNVQLPAGTNGVVPLQLKIGDAGTPVGLTIAVRRRNIDSTGRTCIVRHVTSRDGAELSDYNE